MNILYSGDYLSWSLNGVYYMSQRNAREWSDLYVKEVIHKYNPKFKIRPKRESWTFKILRPVIKFICPTFFTGFITTMFGVMWVPDGFFNNNYKRALQTTAHEGRHEYDRKRLPFGLFELMYTFPQNLFVLFAALAWLTSCWWLLIPALVSLGPWPAPWRYDLEMKGYAMNRIWNKYVYKIPEEIGEANVVHTLSALQTYYSTWPWKHKIYRDLDKPLDLTDPGFADTMDFLKKHGLRD